MRVTEFEQNIINVRLTSDVLSCIIIGYPKIENRELTGSNVIVALNDIRDMTIIDKSYIWRYVEGW